MLKKLAVQVISLCTKKHPEKKHYIIILNPAFEVFLANAAEEVNIDLVKFGFSDWKYFKKSLKVSM